MATNPRKKVVVVGLGMVGISFIEKLLKLDARSREYDIEVLGEEPHLAYNRVGLTTYFGHRQAEKLYLNPQEWYDNIADGALRYETKCRVSSIDTAGKTVTCENGRVVAYDILVLATGSNAVLPRHTPGHDAAGVFVYRNISDLEDLIGYAGAETGGVGAVVGGGLLGLEAAKAMLDLERFDKVVVIERNRWVLSRQLDGEAGGMVVDSVRSLGVSVLLGKRVGSVLTDGSDGAGRVAGVRFEDGEEMALRTVCFAIGVRARDELARAAGLQCAARGGGIVVHDDLQTSAPDVYAIGECASWQGETYGLIGPGVEMADVLAFNLTQAKLHRPRAFKRPDLSTRLKLLGVEVASFGDYFADRDGPTTLPAAAQRKKKAAAVGADGTSSTDTTPDKTADVKALTYKDPFGNVYKKYIFTADGKYLLGGMMIGDTSDYVRLVPMVTKQKALDKAPGELMIGSSGGGGGGVEELDDDTQICSCHNVSKGDVVAAVRDGGCTSLGAVKACTKAGTGCGGCVPLVTSIFAAAMAAAGNEVSQDVCAHFRYSRAELYHIAAVRELRTLGAVMAAAGVRPDSVGCEVCRPVVGSILASLWNGHVMRAGAQALQDTNDRWMGNMQRDGTFSVVPRMAAGEITPARLVVLGEVARDFQLYSKITGGQRIDLFGARKQDLPAIWARLVAAGMESGHAYAKSLRTVKSCVGTTWCRYGVGDAVGLAVRLEERYKSIRGPHKIKGGVSGCVRECAEAQSKDFGLIATEKGFNVYVGGNGGATPRHAELLAKDVPPAEVVPLLDRYLALYLRTADRLQRTARWIEALPGGVAYLRDVVVHDKLGLAAELEAQMQRLVDSYFDEWAEALRDPALRARFQQFANTEETQEGAAERETEREQKRPVFWPEAGKKAEAEADDGAGNEAGGEGKATAAGEAGEKEDDKAATSGHTHLPGDFAALAASWSALAWRPVLDAAYFDRLVGAGGEADDVAGAAVKLGDTQLAVFRVRGRYYATQQMCPLRRAFVLSDGLLGDDPGPRDGADTTQPAPDSHPWVSCPLHKRNFDLATGACRSDPGSGLSLAAFAARVDAATNQISLLLPPQAELDAALGTARWRLRVAEAGPPQMAALDRSLRTARRRVGGNKVTAAPAITAGGGMDW